MVNRFRFSLALSALCLAHCTTPNRIGNQATDLPYINAIKYSWSGGAAGLSGISYEIDILKSDIILRHLWTNGKKLPFRKTITKQGKTTWRATDTEIENDPNKSSKEVLFPIDYTGEAVVGYIIADHPVKFQGISTFEKKSSKDH